MKDPKSPQIREAWVLFFVMGMIMINYPFIHIFNKDISFFGIPLLVFYFLVGWPLSIFVVAIFAHVLENAPQDQ